MHHLIRKAELVMFLAGATVLANLIVLAAAWR
jgi:hypothetical protein